MKRSLRSLGLGPPYLMVVSRKSAVWVFLVFGQTCLPYSTIFTYLFTPSCTAVFPLPSLLPTDWHKFKRLLASKTFATHDTKRIRGENLTAAWAEECGFREPVIAPDKAGLGLKVRTSFPCHVVNSAHD